MGGLIAYALYVGLAVFMFVGFGVFVAGFYWMAAKQSQIPFDMLMQGFFRGALVPQRPGSSGAQMGAMIGALTEPSAEVWPSFATRRGLASSGGVFHGQRGGLRYFIGSGHPAKPTAREAFAKPYFWHLRIEYPRPLGRGLDATRPDPVKLGALRADFDIRRLEGVLTQDEFKVLISDQALEVFHYRPPPARMDFAFETALELAERVAAA